MNKTYFSKFNDGGNLRYVKDADVREVIENTEGFKTFEDNEFTYRKSGGANAIETGLASVERIKGNTIAWNQLSPNDKGTREINRITYTRQVNGTYIANGRSTGRSNVSPNTESVSLVYGHTYLLKGCPKNGSSETYHLNISYYSASDAYLSTPYYDYGEGVVFTQNDNNAATGTIEMIAASSSGQVVTNLLFSPMLIDLTLIYGEGNEPTTVEQFEADYLRWFGKPLTYEEYDEGSLRPVLMSGIKTTGFNQWDEEWENGTISYATGELETNSNTIRSKNFNKISPSTYYYLTCGKHASIASDTYLVAISFYDSNKNFISQSYENKKRFETPQNAFYFKLSTQSNPEAMYGSIYNNDICINISNPSKNGTYEPYQGNTRTLDVTTLKGKLNGAGNSVVVFPDGLKKAGNVQDEIFVEDGVVKAIKRVGSVDLGSLDWEKREYSESVYFESSIINNITLSDNPNIKGNILTPIFNTVPQSQFTNNDNSIIKQCYGTKNYIDIHSTGYNSLSNVEFKSAMQGVILYYKLETPETYILDNNLIDYPVNKYGTEEILSLPNGISPILDINYPVKSSEALHTLPKDYISTKDLNTLLYKLEESTGFKITKIWNSKTNNYEFKYCIAPQGDVQVFADPECTKYATGLATKVYVRLNRDFGFGEGLTIGPTPENSVYINCPQEGILDDPYMVTAYVDWISEDFTEPFKAGQVVECNLPIQAGIYDISEYDKIFTHIPEFVDFGLHSGTIWAKSNLGTTVNNYPGKYYSWGNINGVTSQDPSAITQAAYPNTPGAGLTGNIPNNAEYDAALVGLGSLWSIPTKEQWQELIEYCDTEKAQISGVNGFLIKNKTDSNKAIFLPMVGYVNNSVIGYNAMGSYWSKTIMDSDNAYILQMINDESTITPNVYSLRYTGCSIRPVINRQ